MQVDVRGDPTAGARRSEQGSRVLAFLSKATSRSRRVGGVSAGHGVTGLVLSVGR